MRTSRSPALVVPIALLLLVTSGPAGAQDPDKIPRPSSTTEGGDKVNLVPSPTAMGLGRFLVGDLAPDINLNDQAGRTFHLSVERRVKPWLLVFVRRAEETVQVEAAALGLAGIGLGAVIIAPFGRDRQREWVVAPKLPLLTDRASVTARIYGMFDPVTSNPRPGAFLIDRRGRIVWMISGGLPSGAELVRMTREALEAKGELPTSAEN